MKLRVALLRPGITADVMRNALVTCIPNPIDAAEVLGWMHGAIPANHSRVGDGINGDGDLIYGADDAEHRATFEDIKKAIILLVSGESDKALARMEFFKMPEVTRQKPDEPMKDYLFRIEMLMQRGEIDKYVRSPI